MSILEIIEFPDPVLKQLASPIEGPNPEIEKLASDMIETMYAAPGSGLAANQVGVTRQIFVADYSDDEDNSEPIVLINPRIIEYSDEKVTMTEGCLSVPDFSAEVERAQWIKVLGRDLSGEELEITVDGWLARVFQHEIDHLNGSLYLDHIGRLKRQRYVKKRKKVLDGR